MFHQRLLVIACLCALQLGAVLYPAQIGFAAPGNAPPRWVAAKTRVFVVSMTRYKSSGTAPWGTKGRLDYDLMKLFRARGVPDEQALMLSDEQAEVDSIKRQFQSFLSRSKPGETLIFDFSSHGGYDAEGGKYFFSAFDGSIPVDWFFDAIDRDFKGSRVLMFADCCYSGGIVEIARKRHSHISYACLSTTYCHNVAYSGWRFFDCLIRGFSGDPVVDLDANGEITFDELALFARRHMSFVADGMPMFYTSNNADAKLVIATASGKRRAAPVGNYVMAQHNGEWRKAEIVDTRSGQVQVHYTDASINSLAWLKDSQVRPFQFQHYAPGSAVEVERNGWERAHVKDTWGSMVLCAFDGDAAAYDEWIAPGRIRPASAASAAGTFSTNLGGRWTGAYVNSLGNKGSDSLVLSEDARGNLRGVWSGDIEVSGKRTGPSSASLSGKTSTRTYTMDLVLKRSVVEMHYTARPISSGQTYTGSVTLTRSKLR